MKTQTRWLLCLILLGFCLNGESRTSLYQEGTDRILIQIPRGSFEGVDYRAEGEILLDKANLGIDIKIRLNPLQPTTDQTKAHRAIHDLLQDRLSASLTTLLEDRSIEYSHILKEYPGIADKATLFLSDVTRSVTIGMPLPNYFQAELSMPFDGPGGIADFITSTNIDRPEEADRTEPVEIVTDDRPAVEPPSVIPPPVEDKGPVAPHAPAIEPADVEEEATLISLEIIPPTPSPELSWQKTPSTDRLLQGDALDVASLLLSDIVARELSADSTKFEVAVKSPDGTFWKTYLTEETEDVENFEAEFRLAGEIVEASTTQEISGGSPYKLTFNLTLITSEEEGPIWQKDITREKRRNPSSDTDPYLELAYLIASEVIEEVRAFFQ